MLIGVAHRSVLFVGLARSQLNMFFLSVHHTIPRDKFLDYLKQLPSQKPPKLLFITVFSMKLYSVYERKRGLLVNHDCISWFHTAHDYFCSYFG